MRYDRLSLLMDQVDGHMKAMGLFRMNSLGMVRPLCCLVWGVVHVTCFVQCWSPLIVGWACGVLWICMCAGMQVLSTQRGVIRTNCMDNLDRTNVVQVRAVNQQSINQSVNQSIPSPATLRNGVSPLWHSFFPPSPALPQWSNRLSLSCFPCL